MHPFVSRRSAVLVGSIALATTGLGVVSSTGAEQVCGPAGYQAPTVTSTSLSLARSVAPYGAVDVATVRVSSGAGTPSGTARIAIEGGTSYSVTLNDRGAAQHALPRSLHASRTYTVTAAYDGRGTCRASGPVSKYYTVVRAGTSVRGLDVDDVRAGARPLVTGRVAVSTGVRAHGRVLVVLQRGDQERRQTVTLRDGRFAARPGAVGTRGTWTATARMLADGDLRGSRSSTTFRVARAR